MIFRALVAVIFALVAPIAAAATPTTCWDGSYATGSACPVQVLSITPDETPGSTDATLSVSLAASADTLYVYVKPAVAGACPADPTVAQIISGTGSPTFHDAVASPTSGANSVPVTGLAADTDYCLWAVASKNGNPSAQSSASSNAFTASVPWFTAPVPGDLVKWNPGHYMMATVGNSAPSALATRKSHYDLIANSTAIKGVVTWAFWGNLEPTNDSFSWTTIQDELDYVKGLTVPKRLVIRMLDKRENPDGCANRTYYPQWLVDAGLCVQTRTGSDPIYTYKWWDDTLVTEYIELLQAMAAEFDDDPYFEGIVIQRETAIGQPQNQSIGFSKATYVQHMKEIASAAQAAFDNSTVLLYTNFISSGGTADTQSMLAWQLANGIGEGSPDTAPDCIVRNLDCTSGWYDPQRSSSNGGPTGIPADAYNYTNDNLIGEIPIMWSVESSQLGTNSVGQTGGYSPDLLYRFANQYIGVSHLFWMRKDFGVVAEQTWAGTDGIEDTIEANPTFTNTACPASHVARGGCLTGGTQ